MAVGMVLGHDVTKIVPGKHKGPAFKRGHIIREDEIDKFLDIGKEHVYVIDLRMGYIHEDKAAGRIARAASGQGIRLTKPSEGRVNMIAEYNGLLKLKPEALAQLNGIGQIVFATLHSNHQVKANQAVSGTRVIPLVVSEQEVLEAENFCHSAFPLVEVKPFRSLRVGMVTTGSEVYSGRVKDAFGPVVEKKFQELGSAILRQELTSDDVGMTVSAIKSLIQNGAEMIVVTGGMSVDRDDRTPSAIKPDNNHVIASIAPGEMSSKEFRCNWARLIKKIYETDPLCCPNCKETMMIISLIESGPIVKKILVHLDLWDTPNHDPPTRDEKNVPEQVYDGSQSQIPPYEYCSIF